MDFTKRNSTPYTPLSAFQQAHPQATENSGPKLQPRSTQLLSFEELVSTLEMQPPYDQFRGAEAIHKLNKAAAMNKGFGSNQKRFQGPVQLAAPLPANIFPIELDDIKTPIYFPKSPYPQQVAYVKAMAQAILAGENALLESPTGTGKTLSVLSTSVGLIYHAQLTQPKREDSLKQENTDNARSLVPMSSEELRTELTAKAANPAPQKRKEIARVFYTSRTHSQIIQLVAELKTLPYKVTSVVLGSRDKLCVNPEVEQSPAGERARKCQELVRDSGCKYYTNLKHNSGQQRVTFDDLSNQPMDVEELYTYGKRNCVCPT